MSDLLVRALGWRATVLHGDPQAYALWTWFRGVLDAGCGRGAFTMAAALRGNDALGLSNDERNNGVVQRQLANLTRLLARVDVRLAWAVVFPLCVFTLIDRPLTWLLRYPYFSITVVGIKQA